MIELTWSDRSCFVVEDDPQQIADAIRSCAFDRYYDRTSTGVPDGLPTEVERAAIPIVSRHLSAIRHDWRDNTIYPTDEQRAALARHLVAAIKPLLTEVR